MDPLSNTNEQHVNQKMMMFPWRLQHFKEKMPEMLKLHFEDEARGNNLYQENVGKFLFCHITVEESLFKFNFKVFFLQPKSVDSTTDCKDA